MAFTVTYAPGAVQIGLSGWERLMTWRRALTVDLDTVRAAFVAERITLEAAIDHRVMGVGTHDGRGRPGRRRVGTMLGSGVVGQQFWAVRSGASSALLLVLDLEPGRFARVVVEADDDVSARVVAAVRAR